MLETLRLARVQVVLQVVHHMVQMSEMQYILFGCLIVQAYYTISNLHLVTLLGKGNEPQTGWDPGWSCRWSSIGSKCVKLKTSCLACLIVSGHYIISNVHLLSVLGKGKDPQTGWGPGWFSRWSSIGSKYW